MIDLDPSQPTLVEQTAQGWQVCRAGAREALISFPDRDDAVRFASGLIHAVGGGEMIIRAEDGRVDTLVVSEADLDLPPTTTRPVLPAPGGSTGSRQGRRVRLVDHRRASHPAPTSESRRSERSPRGT